MEDSGPEDPVDGVCRDPHSGHRPRWRVRSGSQGESGHPEQGPDQPGTAPPRAISSFFHCVYYDGLQAEKTPFLYFGLPIYLYLYGMLMFTILPLLRVIFHVLETEGSLSISLQKKKWKRTEIFIFKPFFSY